MPDTDESPYCDNGCGDRATVRLEHVGLCDDCAADQIREELMPLLGKRCCNIGRDGEGNLQVYLTAFGVEHFHGTNTQRFED